MGRTIVGVNDPKAVKKYSARLANDVARTSYFTRKFMSTGTSTPIQKLTDLASAEGSEITYDLVLQLNSAPVEGRDGGKLEGAESELKFSTANVYIDIARTGVNAGTRMTRKRTLHNMREIARDKQKDWWARFYDEQLMMYAAGARGINADFLPYAGGTAYNGRAYNDFTAPDAEHIVYPGTVTAKAGLAAADTLTLPLLDKVKARATMMGGGGQGTPKIQPCKINGADHFVYLMNPWDVYNLRTSTQANNWMDLQKSAAAAEGRKNPIFEGALGMYNGIVLHEHQAVIRFDDYGVGGNVAASRNLFLGCQALTFAAGSPGGDLSFDWHEEMDDRGNELVVDSHSIFGVRKNSYDIDGTVKDFGVIAVDVASAAV